MKRTWAASVLAVALAAPVGAQVRAGGEVAVNTFTTGPQDDVAVAAARDGRFVVVWESQQDGDLDGVVGRRFDAGGASVGGEFAVNVTTTNAQDDASVAVGADGRSLVVWESFDGSADGIFGRRFDASGAPVGAEFQVNTNDGGAEYAPSAAILPGGGFVVTWSVLGFPEPAPDGSNGAVMARRYDAAGAPQGGEFVVNTYTPGYQNFGYVAASANGTFVITWESQQVDGSGYDVFGQRFDAAGNRLGGEFQVNAVTAGNQFSYPGTMADDGRFVVLWLGPDGDSSGIFGRRFDAAGAPLGADFAVNSYTTDTQAVATAANDAGFNFVVTWYSVDQDGSGRGVFGQRFDVTGARRGAEFQVNTYTTDDQGDAWVASDAVGNFVVAWESAQDGSASAVAAQRFGGLFPSALAVDAAGNGVLDPFEGGVEMRPSWRNRSGAPRAIGGTLSDMTGPAGGLYVITDASASYGTVADGASQACSDCYRVSVADAGSRPAPHWDASALESITPDAQGQRKRWTLHVGRSFGDVSTTSGFYRFIETLFHCGITGGCGATTYCPADSTSRAQMSVFVLVAKEGAGYAPPACTTPVFDDVPSSSPFCRFIEELARRGVVSGCGNNNYCPNDAVTREQMAVFALRTLDPALSPPACGTPVFADVPASSPFCRWIEELFRRGVVSGCGGGSYCPQQPVTREQMAVFIAATFSLTLYGP